MTDNRSPMKSGGMMFLSPELTRLSEGIDLLERLRRLFADMYDDAERERAWRFLADRFGEFEKAEMPAWEALIEYDSDHENAR